MMSRIPRSEVRDYTIELAIIIHEANPRKPGLESGACRIPDSRR